MTTLRGIWDQLGDDEHAVLLSVAKARSGYVFGCIDVLEREVPCMSDPTREFINLTAERLLMGQRQYGVLNIATDARDWRRQALEEDVDGAVYRAIAGIAKERASR